MPQRPPAHHPPGMAIRPLLASGPTTLCLFLGFNNLSGPPLGLDTYSDTSFSLKISRPLREEDGEGRQGRDERDYNRNGFHGA